MSAAPATRGHAVRGAFTAPILAELDELDRLAQPPLYVDTRSGADYRRGHIPGAVHLDTFAYANERTDPAGWRKAVADWRAVFAAAGIGAEGTVAFYDGGLENRAARNGFMLRYLGHPAAHVLHGGMTAWVEAGRAREREPSLRTPVAVWELPAREEMVALVGEVEAALRPGGPLLLDVRDRGEFDGRVRLQWNPRMGRIPGAVPLEWTDILASDQLERTLVGTPYYASGMRTRLRNDDEVRGALAAAGVTEGREVIVYCQKSHRASTVYLALERLGLRGRVYPGSFREWSRDARLPVDRATRGAGMSEVVYPTYPDLAGKVAVVTGGSKGIGEATCRALAANGVHVAVVARGAEAIDPLVAELNAAGATAIGVTTDCSKRSELEALRGRVERELGPVDILVPFAGGFRRATPILEISDEEWQFVVESNLTTTFVTTQVFLPGMIERRRGAIVTMASNAGRLLDITLTASYAAAKAGIVMFTRHVAKEVGRHNVRLNCVAPATTLTERVKGVLDEERRAYVAALAPLGRIGAPEDSANATLWLCSEASGWITGITLDIAGGRIML